MEKTEAAVKAACGTPTVTICAKGSVLITIPGYGSTVGVAGVFFFKHDYAIWLITSAFVCVFVFACVLSQELVRHQT